MVATILVTPAKYYVNFVLYQVVLYLAKINRLKSFVLKKSSSYTPEHLTLIPVDIFTEQYEKFCVKKQQQ